MNKENLHELICRYKENYAEINNETNEEIFKWKAVKCFQDAYTCWHLTLFIVQWRL